MSKKTEEDIKKVERKPENKTSKNNKNNEQKVSTKTTKKDQKKIEKSSDNKKSKKRDEKVSSIIKEQIVSMNNIDKIDELQKKEEKEEQEELKAIEKKRKENQEIDEEKMAAKLAEAIKMPKERKLKVNKKIFVNIVWAIIATLYLILINLGGINVEKALFETDLKVFSLVMLVVTIIIFEKAYNKDNGIMAIFGIETLVMGIITLISTYIYILYSNMFINIIGTISMVAIVYYVIKCIIILVQEKRKWKNNMSDVRKLISEP